MKKNYKTAKIYQWSDIQKDLNLELSDVFFEYCNDVAMPWEVMLDEGYDNEITLDKWLIDHGAEECETVYIEINW